MLHKAEATLHFHVADVASIKSVSEKPRSFILPAVGHAILSRHTASPPQDAIHHLSLDMESSNLLKNYANQRLGSRPRKNLSNDYAAVHFLNLYWQDADHPGYRAEAAAMATFFTNKLRYKGTCFPIPSKGSQLRVGSEISRFLLKDDDEFTLHIIYYGGHGDPDDDTTQGEERQSVWAA